MSVFARADLVWLDADGCATRHVCSRALAAIMKVQPVLSRTRGGMKRRATRALLAVAACLAAVVSATVLHYIHEVRVAQRETPALIEAARARYPGQLTVRDMSPERKAMLLAIEDPTFERHHGVDLETPGAGMTTLTQALVK